jgi:hypothetical protein
LPGLEEWGLDLSVVFSFGLIFVLIGLVSGIIDEVVATMTHWNKVSLSYPYLVDV